MCHPRFISMDDALVSWFVKIRAKRRLRNRRTGRTQTEHVWYYPWVTRWSGWATRG
jgi:hypothetical protein